ncbi:MAG: hypothetical protein M3R41_00985 [Pseudomonadota bacterium]|nr:hypothetical protein [Pseudomonadota bacterium]
MLWISGWILASIVSRWSRGKALYPKGLPGAIYKEGWGSGRSLDTLWGRVGGARNCLIISVTTDTLAVTPRFPFNLMFLPEIYGLELTMPLSRVRVQNPASGLLKTRVIIAIDGQDATRMELKVRDRERFFTALAG